MARHPQTVLPQHDREELTAHLVEHLRHVQDARERHAITSRLVEINLPLCDALAARYTGRGADPDDLKQVARTALVSAVNHFRPGEAPSLTAFAVPTITGELKRYFRDRCWMVRPPRALQELRPAAVQARHDLEQKLGRTASAQEIAHRLDADTASVEEALWAHGGYRPASLDAALPGATEPLASLLASDEDVAEDVTQRVALRVALRELPHQDLRMLIWRFGEELTQSEIAARLGVSQMQVSRLLRRILDRLRASLATDEPRRTVRPRRAARRRAGARRAGRLDAA